MLHTAMVCAAHAMHSYGVHCSRYALLWCALLTLCTTMVCTAHAMHYYGVHRSRYALLWCAPLTLCTTMVCTTHSHATHSSWSHYAPLTVTLCPTNGNTMPC